MGTIIIVIVLFLLFLIAMIAISTNGMKREIEEREALEKRKTQEFLEERKRKDQEKQNSPVVSVTHTINLIKEPIVSHRVMTTIKPDNVKEGDMDYVFHTDEGNFCALSVFRLDNTSASTCRIGVVKVENNVIVKEGQFDFAPFKLTKKFCQEVGEEYVSSWRQKPSFTDIWPLLQDYFSSQILLIYDIGIDNGAISYLLSHHSIDHRPLSFIFAISKTKEKLNVFLEKNGLSIKPEDSLVMAKVLAMIEMGGLKRDDLFMLRKH